MLFHVMRYKAIAETDVLADAVEAFRQRLPSDWRIAVRPPARVAVAARREGVSGGAAPPPVPFSEIDAFLDVRGPGGVRTTLLVEVKSKLDPKDVTGVLERVRRSGSQPALILAPYLGPRTRELLAQARASYADSTGNLRLDLEHPLVFIETTGAASNPWPEERSLRSLKGPAAGRIVRALCDFEPPYGIRELAGRAGVSAPSVARVVDLLDREAIIQRELRGPVTAVDWAALLRRWVQDFSFTGSNVTRTFLEPRGLEAMMAKLGKSRLKYSVTGSLAADAVSVAPARLGAVYVRSIREATGRLGLRAAETGGNVVLAEPFDTVVFERTREHNGITYAAYSQVVADLLTSPGRGPAEADELIRWMERNERAWRS